MDNTDITVISRFKDPVDASPENLLRLQDLCTDTVTAKWAEAGFSDIFPLAETDLPADTPVFTAQFDGAPCLICLAPPAPNPMELHSITEAQCKLADEFALADFNVYASSLVLWADALVLLQPVCVRSEGVWQAEDAETEQFLPRERRGGGNVIQALLGDVYLFKLFRVLMPYLASKGKPCKFRINGLFAKLEPEAPWVVTRCHKSPTWMLLMQRDEEQKCLVAKRPVFYHDSDVQVELELVGVDAACPELGISQLLSCTGKTLYAECLESAIFKSRMPLSRRYRWALSMVAEMAENNTQEFRITEGPLFELQKAEYCEENGSEPPADFAVTVSTAQMRVFNQTCEGENAAYATACGVITALEIAEFSPLDLPGGRCLRASVSCLADEEESLISLYLTPAVLGDWEPKVGDNIRFSGMLYAVPDALCETGESWQDSPEVAALCNSQDARNESMHTLERYRACSVGFAVAAAAFTQAGWTVETAEPELFSRRVLQLSVSNQRGELAVVFVDVVLNGREPARRCTEFREKIEAHYLREEFGVKACYFCTVALDYNPEADRYAVSMSMEPACDGVENRLLYIAPAYRADELPQEPGAPLPPSDGGYDEALAARLFCEAMAEGRWGAFAACLREEMTYTSGTRNAGEYGKIDYLRYITERVEDWKHRGTWPYFRFAVGRVMVEGTYRPCMAMYYLGIPSGITVFNMKSGLVETMQTLPWQGVQTYIEESEPFNNNELEEATPRPLCETIYRPPHAAVMPFDRSALPQNTENARALLQVLQYLELRGTPAVETRPFRAPLPHLWLRELDGRLAFGIVMRAAHAAPHSPRAYSGPIDAVESKLRVTRKELLAFIEKERAVPYEQKDALPPELLRHIIGTVEEEHLRQIRHYPGYIFCVFADGFVTLRRLQME